MPIFLVNSLSGSTRPVVGGRERIRAGGGISILPPNDHQQITTIILHMIVDLPGPLQTSFEPPKLILWRKKVRPTRLHWRYMLLTRWNGARTSNYIFGNFQNFTFLVFILSPFLPYCLGDTKRRIRRRSPEDESPKLVVRKTKTNNTCIYIYIYICIHIRMKVKQTYLDNIYI